jgi:hypothetical protein
LAQQIRSVAIRMVRSGVVLSMDPPARHHDILHDMADWIGRPLQRSEHVQGFLSATGKFMTREDAARMCGREGQLYSEDLW